MHFRCFFIYILSEIKSDTSRSFVIGSSDGRRPDTASDHGCLCGGGVWHQNPVIGKGLPGGQSFDGVLGFKARVLNPAVVSAPHTFFL